MTETDIKEEYRIYSTKSNQWLLPVLNPRLKPGCKTTTRRIRIITQVNATQLLKQFKHFL
jgi:hypothetical protein